MPVKTILFALVTALTFSMPSFAHGEESHGGLLVEKVWARKTSRTVSAAVYLTIRNEGHNIETLLGAHTDIADTTMIHRSYEEDGVMKMGHVMSLPMKPGETLEFKPGGYHVMLMGLTGPLKKGDVFPLVLSFEKAGDVQVIVEITGMMGPK